MKKIISILCICLAVVVISSCVKAKKHVEDYFVKVKTVSADVQDDGSVLVTAEIESDGGAKAENIGFSCGTSENHALTCRQVDGNLNGTIFTGVIDGLDADSTYYFRAFATNAYGYSRGNSIALSNIKPTPVVATCTFVTGFLDLDGFPPETNLSFPNLSNSLGIYYSNGGTSFTNVEVRFFGVPKTKVYTSEFSYDPSGPSYVSVHFNRSTISGSLAGGVPVYVNEISPGVFDVYICSGSWTYSSTTFYFKSHFTVSL